MSWMILGCGDAEADTARSGNFTISAGESVGSIELADTKEIIEAKLGSPSMEDAAMRRLEESWKLPSPHGNGIWLSVLFIRDVSGLRYLTEELRVSSPRFRTADGISTQSSLGEIEQHYGKLPRTSFETGNGSIILLDARERGIAFEMDSNGKCVAILVHRPGKEASLMTSVKRPDPVSHGGENSI